MTVMTCCVLRDAGRSRLGEAWPINTVSPFFVPCCVRGTEYGAARQRMPYRARMRIKNACTVAVDVIFSGP